MGNGDIEVSKTSHNSVKRGTRLATLVAILAILVALPLALTASNKKKDAKAPEKPLIERLDYSRIVWPNPPAITRVRFMDIFSADKIEKDNSPKKSAWMDRLAGVATGENLNAKPHYQLVTPYGMAIDSKGRLYVADEKVGAIFIFDTETKKLDLIKNGVHAHFKLITGLAIDDADRLFVSDSVMNHVLVFGPDHRAEASISQGMASPAGIAIDTENRFLYVCDTELDQVLVYDADAPYKLLRKMGAPSKHHELTGPGDFSRPTNIAVDKDGNVYVSDTFNDRVEIFDADGNFIRTFGKPGDGPGYFARPKGIAVDADGHIWVADGVQNRVQVFNPEGQVLLWMGSNGLLPGQFSALAGLAIDKNNRVFTSEQYIGRVQMFRYITNDEALAEKKRRDDAEKAKLASRSSDKASPSTADKSTATVQPPANAPAPQ